MNAPLMFDLVAKSKIQPKPETTRKAMTRYKLDGKYTSLRKAAITLGVSPCAFHQQFKKRGFDKTVEFYRARNAAM